LQENKEYKTWQQWAAETCPPEDLKKLLENLEMKPSEQCKQAGLSSLKQLADISGESVQTLNNWSKNKPLVFDLVLRGAVVKKLQKVLGA